MNADILLAMRRQVHDALQSRARQKAVEKDEETRLRVEADLHVEDCIFQGLDPNNVVDRAVIIRTWLAEHQEEDDLAF